MLLAYGHDDNYWGKDIYRWSFDELMADYFSITANGRTDLLAELRGVAGDELFDALSGEYVKIIEKA